VHVFVPVNAAVTCSDVVPAPHGFATNALALVAVGWVSRTPPAPPVCATVNVGAPGPTM